MTSRLQILKNGQHVATIGIEGAGVSSVTLGTAEKAEGESDCDLTVGVLTFPESPTERQRWMSWPMPDISEGDEITVRILPPGTCDPPDESTGGEEKVIDDPEFGRLSYLIDAWDGDIEFTSGPIRTAHIHICSDESGITDEQRQQVHDIASLHDRLWPEIRDALIRCHVEIETTDEMERRVNSEVGINIYRPDGSVELSYSIEGDPELRGYFVTLRDGQIAEVTMAE